MSRDRGIIGDNSGEVSPGPLRACIERIERLESEKSDLTVDIREVYLEAKSTGLDVRIMRRVVARRKIEAAKRREEDQILELYLSALGKD